MSDRWIEILQARIELEEKGGKYYACEVLERHAKHEGKQWMTMTARRR